MKKIRRVIYKVDRSRTYKKFGLRTIYLSDETHGNLHDGKRVTKIGKKWIIYV